MYHIALGDAVKHVHFIGIGGVSMSALAELLLRDGYTVTGSDAVLSDATEYLRRLGIQVAIGNTEENITPKIDLVVYTAAVTPDNPEYKAALDKRIPMMDRARLLGRIMEGYAYPVCIAGTHGKTGTTALVAEACLTAGLDPTILVGGYMGEGYNFRIGASPYFVMEACEYFDSFLQWRPYVGMILNVDSDHMDYFGTMDRLIDSFARFARNIQPQGALVIYAGTPGFETITQGLACRVITYGTEDADYNARQLRLDEDGHPSFAVWHRDTFITEVSMRLYGEKTALNAVGVAAVCQVLGMAPTLIGQGLSGARGVKRRFEHKGVFNGADVVDDYAHHPTEIRATLAAARAGRTRRKGRIICAFQPHTYSRTKNLAGEFATAFGDADQLVLLPTYASREAFHASSSKQAVTSFDLAEKVRENGTPAHAVESFDEAVKYLAGTVMPGDLLITMGAGDVYLVGERLLLTDLSTLSTGC